MTSHAGMLLLRQTDRKFGVLHRAATCFKDPRRKASSDHQIEAMLRQRVFALAAGEEDLNDHNELRHDVMVQTAVERTSTLASAPLNGVDP